MSPDRELDDPPGNTGASLEDLYADRYHPMVRLAYLLTGSMPVAEDVVQDAFARLHQHWLGVQQPAAYLRTSVVNGCRGFHRRAGRERSHFPELAAAAVTPETPVILDALARLPYRQRAALVLRYWEDRPESAIAELLGCRPATVRSLVRRGLASLREVIER